VRILNRTFALHRDSLDLLAIFISRPGC